jgi:hypothetical protein
MTLRLYTPRFSRSHAGAWERDKTVIIFNFIPYSFQNEVIMPQLLVDVSIRKVADIIRTMNPSELETLHLLLTDDGKELLSRKQDLELNRVKFLSREAAILNMKKLSAIKRFQRRAKTLAHKIHQRIPIIKIQITG